MHLELLRDVVLESLHGLHHLAPLLQPLILRGLLNLHDDDGTQHGKQAV